MTNIVYRPKPASPLVDQESFNHALKKVVSNVLLRVDIRDLNSDIRDLIENAQIELSYNEAHNSAIDSIKYDLQNDVLNIMECEWYKLAMPFYFQKSLNEALSTNDGDELRKLLSLLSNRMLTQVDNTINLKLHGAFSNLLDYVYDVYEIQEYFVFYAKSDLILDMKLLELGVTRTIDTNGEHDIILLSTTVISENKELLQVATNNALKLGY